MFIESCIKYIEDICTFHFFPATELTDSLSFSLPTFTFKKSSIGQVVRLYISLGLEVIQVLCLKDRQFKLYELYLNKIRKLH